ncbi:MAG TPA: prolyl oligopeptidase family serine peptidase [Candidatus Limnocylindrales bacterium]
MTEAEVRPYGAWESPFGLELLTAGVVRITEPTVDGERIWWLEGRPSDGGRQTLVRRDPDGSTHDVSPAGMNVRDRVHEYGGGAYLARGDVVIVSSFNDGRLYRVGPDRTAEPLTPEGPFRYADLEPDERRGRLLAIREDHGPTGEAINSIVAIALDDGAVTVLVEGADFCAAPRLSPDGSRLARVEWNHPNMPWDGTTLRMAALDAEGRPGDATTIAGSPTDWVSEPRWSASGVLHFIAEPNGWMNLQRVADGRIEPIAPMEVEFGAPEWTFGWRTYDIDADGSVVAIGRAAGRDRLYRLGPTPGEVVEIPTAFTELAFPTLIDGSLVALAASPTATTALVRIDLPSGRHETIRRSTSWQPDPGDLSVGRPIEFPTTGGRTAHGIFYAPHNPRFRPPDGERPPLIVTSHGGPTSAATTALSVTYQIFTSRGIAVLDVDYGGSTGYGRDYRKRLDGEWGIVDVDDCVAGAEFLAERGLIDPARLVVRGGSASGFTTLAGLAFRDVFAAGITYFGLGDLRAFVRETHKFESRYLERLVGQLPEMEARYRERSPALHADRISVPVLVLQGLEDRVVPPSEAERIVDALWERRVPHAYIAFEGEDHGFRQAASIIRSAEAELSFLGQVFGFEPADNLEPVTIEHLVSAGG